MKVTAIKAFRLKGNIVTPGTVLELSIDAVSSIGALVKPYKKPEEPFAWLTENGELRSRGCIQDLEAAIVALTTDNIPLQRTLLLRHSESYDTYHLPSILKKWREDTNALILTGIDRTTAEQAAAKKLHLLAFIPCAII